MSDAPAIIIFGAGLRPDGTPTAALTHRIAAALAFGRGLPDTLYLPTGGVGRHGPSEARAILRRRGHRGAVYAATSAYHLPRCLVLLRLAGVRARAVPPLDVPAAPDWGMRWYWRLREVPALPWDVLLMLLRRRT